MVQLLNSIYLGAATPSDYGKAAGVVELLPFDYYLGAAVPSHGKPTINVLLSGVSPLTLLNAVSLNYVKAFGKCEHDSETYIDSVTLDGKCEQDGTPTPTSPVDIVANNGAIKVRHQSGLPLEYTLLDSVIFDSTQVIDTGFTPNNNSRIESKCYRTGTNCWFYGASPNNPRVTLFHSDLGTSRWGNQSRSNLGLSATTEYTLIQDKNGLTINGTLYPWNAGTAGDFTCDRSLTIGNNNGSTGTRYFAGNLYYMKIYDNDVLARDFVPCKNASNVVGLYDRVNGGFYTDTGLVAGNPVSDSVEIYYDGTAETATDNVGNVATAQPLLSVGNYKDTQEVLTGAVTRNVGIKVLDGTENWLKISGQNACYTSISDMLYCNPVQPGLSNQFIGAGVPTANMPDNSIKLSYTSDNSGAILFKHNDTTTLEDWVQFVTDKYNSGNPIIAIYPLATPTTETVSGQILNKEPVTVTGSLTGLVANVVSSTHTVQKPTQPLDIVANNGVIKVSQNLLNPSKIDRYSTTQLRWYYQDGYLLKAGKTYTFSTNYTSCYLSFMRKSDNAALTPTTLNTVSYTATEDILVYFRAYKPSLLDDGYNYQLELGSTATEYRPYGQIYVDGTVETVTTKQSFVNDSDVVDKTGLSSNSGSTISNANRCYVLFPCKAGVTYTAQTDTADLIGGNFIEYRQPSATSANFIKSITATDDGLVDGVYQFHAVCDRDGWAGWQCKANKETAMANNWQITADTSSATCQPLLSVGDYKDVQNITNGAITRNVSVYLLDGTENWIQATTSLGVYRYRFEPTNAPKLDGGRGHCISTHFFDIGGVTTQDIGGVFASTTYLYFIPNQDVDTVAKWTAFLADQYANGTPVIVVYPLATPTTETVTGQTLTITQGTNIVTAEGSVSDLELEVSYKAYAEVTVEEIEAVNTDESVDVIIS